MCRPPSPPGGTPSRGRRTRPSTITRCAWAPPPNGSTSIRSTARRRRPGSKCRSPSPTRGAHAEHAARADAARVDHHDVAVAVDVLLVVVTGEDHERLVIGPRGEGPRQVLGEPVVVDEHDVGALGQAVEPGDEAAAAAARRLVAVGQLGEAEDALRDGRASRRSTRAGRRSPPRSGPSTSMIGLPSVRPSSDSRPSEVEDRHPGPGQAAHQRRRVVVAGDRDHA